ncbi:hypothetical protein [Kribbella endophytica]
MRRLALRLNGRIDRRLGVIPAGEHTDATRRRQEQARDGELSVEQWRIKRCEGIDRKLAELEAEVDGRLQPPLDVPPEHPSPPQGFPGSAWTARRAGERAAAWDAAVARDRAAAVQIAALKADRETVTQSARAAAAMWQVWFNEQVAIYERSRQRRRTEPARVPPDYLRAMLCEMPPDVGPVATEGGR